MESEPRIVPTDDFWSRRSNAQTHAFECAPYGIQAIITANERGVLSAAQLSARRYSTVTSRIGQAASRTIRMQIVVTHDDAPPPPADLASHLKYTGLDEWIMLSAGGWGHSFANLETRRACLALSPALAIDTRFVSRYFIDHYVLNLMLTEWAMLHASCVMDAARRRLILMVATHNTGKSTTALQLVRAGYAFLADGMATIRVEDDQLQVGGYPLGEVKLRGDVLAQFADYAGESVLVREQQKTIIDLRAAHPDRVIEHLVSPEAFDLCFVERHDAEDTRRSPIGIGAALSVVAANTVFWNEAAKLEHNTRTLHRLLRVARLHHMQLGRDPERLVAAFQRLAG